MTQSILLAVAFLVFIVILYMLTRLAGQFGRRMIFKTNQLKLAESLYFTPQKGLHLILVGKKVLLIGVTEQSISLVKEIDDPDLIESLLEEAAARKAKPVSVPLYIERILSGIRSRFHKRIDAGQQNGEGISAFHKKFEDKLNEIKKINREL